MDIQERAASIEEPTPIGHSDDGPSAPVTTEDEAKDSDRRSWVEPVPDSVRVVILCFALVLFGFGLYNIATYSIE